MAVSDHELLQSYASVLEMKIRKMQLEAEGRVESDDQFEQRLDIETDHDILELKYCTYQIDFVKVPL